MKKNKSSLARKIGIGLFIAFLCLSASIGLVQSTWGKEKAKAYLMDALKESGFKVEIGKISGSLPYRIELEGIALEGKGFALQIQSLETNISLLKLLRKELAFSWLNANGISWKKTEIAPSSLSENPFEQAAGVAQLPFPIYIESFHLTNVSLSDSYSVDLTGRMRLSKQKSFLDAKITRDTFPDSSARLAIVIKKEGAAQMRLHVKTPTLKALPLPSSDFDSSLNAQIYAAGPIRSFWQTNPGQKPLEGQIRGTFSPTSIPLSSPMNEWAEGEGSFTARFSRSSEGKVTLSRISVKNDFLKIKGRAEFDPEFHFVKAGGQIESDKILGTLPFGASGHVLAYVNVREANQGIQTNVQWRADSLSLLSYKAEKVKGKGEALWENGALKGATSLSFALFSTPWEAKTDFSWTKGGSLALPNWTVSTSYLNGKGNLELRPDLLLIGTSEIEIENLQSLHIPEAQELFGSLKAKASWQQGDTEGTAPQTVSIDVSLSDLYYGKLFSRKVSFYSDLVDPFHRFQGNADLAFEKLKWGDLELETIHLIADQVGPVDSKPTFKLLAEGKWKHPLEIRLDGSWNYQNREFIATLEKGGGTFFKHPFLLVKPLTLDWSSTVFAIQDLELKLADASVSGFIDRKGDRTDASLKMDHVPLDILSLNPLDVPIGGTLTFNAQLHEEKERLSGEFKASIDQMEIETSSDESGKLLAEGTFSGKFNRDRLDLRGDLEVKNNPLLDLDLSIPIQLSIWPFQASLLPHQNARGHIAFNGRIEDFLDFFDLGSHRLEGECNADIRFSNTLYRPHMKGSILFEEGHYQNYYSGTELRSIRAEWVAEKEILALRTLTAQDSNKKGKVSAVGEIRVRPDDLYPFRFDIDFSRFNFIQIDLVNAEADGKINIVGNRSSAIARGKVEILESELSIPDHIPRPLPDLKVVYRNPIHPVHPIEVVEYKPYPLFLDLHVTAPDGILIGGRGLYSEWNGDFQIGGTYSSLTAQGKLQLVKGEFVFSGRSFKLTEGALSFSGKEHEMPYLNLAGNIEQKGILITARLKGPLNNPQITFQSVPPLPMNSIVSYLLFGQDISEISGFQALQLASSIANLAGQGPDVMESTRKALGVDRLRIISSPTEEGGETVALQVGTYVSDGVIISISQGTEDSSSNVSIEVELKDNFVFQAETQQQQEQGKFSIKWNLNY